MTVAVKPQIHWSHISMLLRCGEQYRRRYLEGERMPPGVAIHVGSATHAGIEANMLHKIKCGQAAPESSVTDATRDALARKWTEEGAELEADERSRGEAIVRGEAIDEAVGLSLLHYRDLAPSIAPAHVERAWVVELQGFPRDLAGRIDLQEIPRSGRRSGTIHDTKTCKRTPPSDAADDNDQLTMYALAARVLDGEIPPLTYDALVKLKRPKAMCIQTRRTEQDLTVMFRRIERVNEALDKGVFLPSNQSNWWCSEKWCGYAKTCPYYRGRVQG